jgi:hypothetical protein
MREISHFIGGKTVAGGSGHLAAMFDNTGGAGQGRRGAGGMEQAIANAERRSQRAATNPQRRGCSGF